VIQVEEGAGKKMVRNDRIVAVEKDAHSWDDIKTVSDLGKQFSRELEEFFVNYHKLSGEAYRVLRLRGPDPARGLVKAPER
jgi:inorganic pyrophosphatase